MEFNISNLTDLYTPVTITLSLDIPDHSLEAGKYLLFKMPLQGNEFDFMSDYLLRGTDIQDREYPLKLMATFVVLFEEVVDIPQGWSVKSLPEDVNISGTGFEFDSKTTTGHSQVTMAKKMTFASMDIPLEEIPHLQHMLKDRSLIDRGRVFLLKD